MAQRRSNFVVRGGADFSNLNKALNQTQARLGKFQSTVSKSMKFVGFALGSLAVGKLVKDSTQMAMSVESAADNIRRNMGSAASAFERFADTQAKALGMARKDAYTYGSVFSNLLDSFMTDKSQVASETEKLIRAAAVISSKTGRTYEDVANRIRSGMLGSTEAIEDLGVYTNISMIESTEAFKKFAGNKSWNQLDYRTQQQIRLAAILEQAYKRYGDTLANTTQTKQAMFLASLENIKLNLGQAFLSIYNVILPALNALASKLEVVTARIAVFTQAIFGKANSVQAIETQTDAFVEQGNAISDLGDEVEKAGKKAKKALAPFDELNVLTSQTSGSGSAGSTSTQSIVDIANTEQEIGKIETIFDKLKLKFAELSEIFKEGFAIGFGTSNFDSIANSINNIKKSLKSIFTSPEVTKAADNWANKVVLALGKITGSIASIGSTIAEFFVGSIDKYFSQNADFLRSKIVSLLDISARRAEIYSKYTTALADIYSVFRSDQAKQIGADLIGIFANSFVSVTEFAWSFGTNIIEAITRPITENKDAIKKALENTLASVRTIVGGIKNFLDKTFASIKQSYDTYISPAIANFGSGFNKVFKGVLDGYNQYLAPTIDKISGKFVELVDTYLSPLIKKILDFIGSLIYEVSRLWDFLSPFVGWLATNFFEKISNSLETAWGLVEVIFKQLINTLDTTIGVLQGVLDFIVGVFTGDWGRAWNGIEQVFTSIIDGMENSANTFIEFMDKAFSGIGDTIKTTFKGAINGVITLFNKFIGWVNSKLKFSWDGLKIAGKTIFEGGTVQLAKIPSIPQLARGGIVDSPTLAMIGEAGKEAVVPLENTGFVTTIASAIANEIKKVIDASRSSGGSSNGDVVVRVGEDDFARIAIKAITNANRRAGGTLLEGVL